MIIDHTVSCSGEPDEFGSAKNFSRRAVLKATAAAGGGLMLSLRLPFAAAVAEAAGSAGFAPNAFIASEATGRLS
jgi:isoquinoline 1-oxidoreductase subunit beta